MVMSARACSVILVLALALACAPPSPAPVSESAAQTATGLEGCVPGQPTAEALLPAGLVEGGAIVPIGRKVTPAGRLTTTQRWPLAAAFSPDGAWAYVTHNGGKRVDVIDVEAGAVVQTLPYQAYRGVAAHPDGQHVFVAATGGQLVRLVRQADGTLAEDATWPFVGFLSALALSPGGSWLYLVSNSNSRVWQIDPGTGEVHGELSAQIYPYGIAVAPDETTVYVSNAGGDDVSLLDFAGGAELAVLPMDLNPMGVALTPDGATLFVANSDADSISVVDTRSLALVDTLDLRAGDDLPPGASPNELVMSPEGTRLFVSRADLNEVTVVDVVARVIVGRIPTAFYPTGVALDAAGTRLLVCNSKGYGSSGSSPNNVGGSLSLIDLPTDDDYAAWTAQVEANNGRMGQFYPTACAYPVPKALTAGEERLIEHVVVVLKENKTYDAVFGDFERGRGDPALTTFGRTFTPNAHALAERFTLMDNYYCDSEHSTQGHNWATQADANDLFEKTDYTQTLLLGFDPSIVAQERTIFDHLYDHDVSFRVYGQWVGLAKDWFGEAKYEAFVNQKVPFFNQSVRDVVKAREVLREIDLGIFPSFVFVALPNDHTYGTKAGRPTPEVMVADNDHALGLLVEGISKSPYWEKTVLFVIQDDAQGYGGDHVHPQRSPCLVIGPWARKGYTSSVHYSMPSVFRTVEMLFGLPAMNLNTATVAPMYDSFLAADEQPDTAPYQAIEPQVPYAVNTAASFMAAESEQLDMGGVDRSPGLGYILWHHMKGPDVQPPPYAKWNDE